MIEQRQITDRDEWLRWREEDVTASVAGALLGLHPYCTALQLYMAKTGLVSLDNGDSGPMRRGRLIEPVAMQIVKEEHPEWRVEAPAVYLRDPEHKLGCTPDLYASTSLSRGVIEIKSVEPSAFRRTWLDESRRHPGADHHRHPGARRRPPAQAAMVHGRRAARRARHRVST